MRKFLLLKDRLGNAAGSIVYECSKNNYGLVSDDERATGVKHIAVTENPDGDYPFITAPVSILEEIINVS